MNQEEQQKKAMEFQILNSQFEQSQEQLKHLQQQKESISNLLSNLKDADSVFMAVGANVIVKKPLKEAEKTLEERENQITLMVSQLESQVNQLGNMINHLQQELQ